MESIRKRRAVIQAVNSIVGCGTSRSVKNLTRIVETGSVHMSGRMRIVVWMLGFGMGLGVTGRVALGQEEVKAGEPSSLLISEAGQEFPSPAGNQRIAERFQGIWGSVPPTSTYRVLPRPTQRGTVPATPLATQQVRAMQPYAYGYFGPKTTPSWSRSFGHRKSYTQWTLK